MALTSVSAPRTTRLTPLDATATQAARSALLASVEQVPIYDLTVELETVAPIELAEHPGSALRGALVQALLDTHCTNKAAPSCAACPLVRLCPVSMLVAPLRDEAPRGRDVPRPFVITPPLPSPRRLEAGASWSFGLTLFGAAATLFPYIVLSHRRLETNGLGQRSENGRRGRVTVRRIASNTNDGSVTLYEPGAARVGAPTPVTGAARIAARAAALPPDRLTLRFLSPMRLKGNGAVLPTVQPSVLVHRILERWEGLRREYGRAESPDPLAPLRGPAPAGAWGDARALLAVADEVVVERADTHWVDLASYSSRQRRFTPIGGFVGEATLAGEVGALSEVLALGEVIRVGKDVVKGNGRYEIMDAPCGRGEGGYDDGTDRRGAGPLCE